MYFGDRSVGVVQGVGSLWTTDLLAPARIEVMCERLYVSRELRVHCRAGLFGRILGGHELCFVVRRGHVALSDRVKLGLIGGGGAAVSWAVGFFGGLVGGIVDSTAHGAHTS